MSTELTWPDLIERSKGMIKPMFLMTYDTLTRLGEPPETVAVGLWPNDEDTTLDKRYVYAIAEDAFELKYRMHGGG